jgi:hypothetical protein
MFVLTRQARNLLKHLLRNLLDRQKTDDTLNSHT